jgi:hypothetical protein
MLLNNSATTKIASKAIGATRAMSGKEIKFGVEGRAAMLKGVNLLADAVQVSFSFRLLYFAVNHLRLVYDCRCVEFCKGSFHNEAHAILHFIMCHNTGSHLFSVILLPSNSTTVRSCVSLNIVVNCIMCYW